MVKATSATGTACSHGEAAGPSRKRRRARSQTKAGVARHHALKKKAPSPSALWEPGAEATMKAPMPPTTAAAYRAAVEPGARTTIVAAPAIESAKAAVRSRRSTVVRSTDASLGAKAAQS